MTSRLSVASESVMKVPGIVAVALVDSDGCVIENVSCGEVDFAASAASASQILRQWALLGTDLDMGTVQSVLIERESGPATITPVGRNAALLVLGNRLCRPGHLRREVRRAREAMDEVERAGPSPEASPPPPADLLSNLVRTTEEVSPAPAPRLTTGEVVLIGAHTFRLVTKLIAQLLQMKGVQSSYLRAYSPAGTIIDVVLEDGATLATISRSGLEEFAIERTEDRGARLVLRAETALATSPTPIGSRG